MLYNGPLTPDYSDYSHYMASFVQPPPLDLVHTYRMVSQKYLDLTRQKLELVRLPQAPRNASKSLDVGASKENLEPIIDHWLEAYNWRKQEDFYNDTLPQFRVPINGTRLHFVHKRSRIPAAVPLLFIHGVPESFIAVSKMANMLSSPLSGPSQGDSMTAFHVVAPSIPGMGFSDPVSEQSNNLQSTCDIFDALMKGLGYNQYVIHGSGWGFNIARAIALTHPESCMAIHTVNPEVPAPRLGFGFNPNDEMSMLGNMPTNMPMPPPQPNTAGATPPITPNVPSMAAERPQTAAYALCDSPSGLLAYMYDAIRPEDGGSDTTSPSHSPESLRPPSSATGYSPSSSYAASHGGATPASRSGRSTAGSSPVATRRTPPSNRSPPKLVSQSSSSSSRSQQYESSVSPADAMQHHAPWHPAAIIDWTMIYWLPGPEVMLRWLVNSTALLPTYWAGPSMVPLGISHFRDSSASGTGKAPPQWAEAYHRVAMVKRREGRVRFPAWEVPVEVVMDLREFAGLLGLFGAAPAPMR